MSKKYYDDKNKQLTINLRAILSDLPPYTRDFFRSIETTTSIQTRINYAYDLRVFFTYLISENKNIKADNLHDISISDLDKLELRDLEMYVEYLTLYFKEDNSIENNPSGTKTKINENNITGKKRKIASLRTFFKYCQKAELLKNNISPLLTIPKIPEKPMIRLDINEVADLLDIIETGEGLTPKQLTYHQKNVKRDLALVTLMLSTGIRVSELVGLDIKDIDFENYSFKVIRKGGNYAILYFGSEANSALKDYLSERKNKETYGLDMPLFINPKNERLSVRSVQNMIKKYSKIASPLKDISPHKLRKTYGTTLYNETGDIYLVADILGHKDVNTTRKHYANIMEDRRKDARNTVKLR